MIFNAAHIEELIREYHITRNPDVQNTIVIECDALISAIVYSRGYPPHLQEDMKQECRRKILYGINNYKPTGDPSRLHKYMTSVVLNACRTTSQKDFKVQGIEDDAISLDDFDIAQEDDVTTIDMTHLISRNRRRFPSIDTDTIDQVTMDIHSNLTGEYADGNIIRHITRKHQLSAKISKAIYYSTVAYLRYTNTDRCRNTTPPDEFTIYADLSDLFGKDVYNKIVNTFDAILLKIG